MELNTRTNFSGSRILTYRQRRQRICSIYIDIESRQLLARGCPWGETPHGVIRSDLLLMFRVDSGSM
jgi:hypothetical protein